MLHQKSNDIAAKGLTKINVIPVRLNLEHDDVVELLGRGRLLTSDGHVLVVVDRDLHVVVEVRLGRVLLILLLNTNIITKKRSSVAKDHRTHSEAKGETNLVDGLLDLG